MLFDFGFLSLFPLRVQKYEKQKVLTSGCLYLVFQFSTAVCVSSSVLIWNVLVRYLFESSRWCIYTRQRIVYLNYDSISFLKLLSNEQSPYVIIIFNSSI